MRHVRHHNTTYSSRRKGHVVLSAMSTMTQDDIRIMGLTGGIATGKSFVAEVLEQCGAYIIDADVAAREVVQPETPGLARVAQHFGCDVLHDDGSLNRVALGRIVFADDQARKTLEDILHPYIHDHMKSALQHAVHNVLAPVVVLDIPLLFETNML